MGVCIRVENPSRETRGTCCEKERRGNWGDVFVLFIQLGLIIFIIYSFIKIL
jgi:hypothetical protein